MESLYFNKTDCQNFRSWLNLDLNSITWGGAYKDEFEDFWTSIFGQSISCKELINRLNYLSSKSNVGPLVSWFTWLKEKLISYIFIHKNITLLELSRNSGEGLSSLSFMLRNFFLEFVPREDKKLSSIFQVSYPENNNVNLSFESLNKSVQLPKIENAVGKDEIIAELEVTLYEEWGILIQKIKKDIIDSDRGLSFKNKRKGLKKLISIVKEVFLLLIIGGGIIYVIKYGNILYEKHLIKKIGIYEHQFNWLDTALIFKPFTLAGNTPELPLHDIENLDKKNQIELEGRSLEEQRFDVESEVVLTSWNSLPKDFNKADLEQSDYEENSKRGYRANRYGNTKVYRLMITSVGSGTTRVRLEALLKKYKINQVDNVKPGKIVPGGIYYNIFVPRIYLKEFMREIVDKNERRME